jgi:hypothetical protein
MFLKFGEVWVSAPQEGAGGMRGGHFEFWRADGNLKNSKIILKTQKSRLGTFVFVYPF